MDAEESGTGHTHAQSDASMGTATTTITGLSGAEQTALETAIAQWKKVNLSALKRDIDEDALAMEQRKEERDASRQKLKTNTKAFKKTLDSDAKAKFAPIISLFQSEVQLFLKMCRQSDTAFLAIYEKLIDADDPHPHLVRMRDLEKSLEKAEAKVRELEMSTTTKDSKLQHYKSTLSGAKHNETTIRQLEEQIASLEMNMNTKVEGRVREEAHKLDQDYAQKAQHHERERAALEQKLAAAEKTAQSAEESLKEALADALQAHQNYEEEVETLSRAAEMANSQAESALARVQELQAELFMSQKQLKEALAVDHSSSQQSASSSDASLLEEELAQKDKELARVLANHHSLQSQFSSMKQDYEQRLLTSDETIRELQADVQEARKEAEARNDYDTIKEELLILRRIEFGDHDSSFSQPLEALLQRKNSSLESENTELRNRHTELEAEISHLKDEQSLRAESDARSKKLVAQLESHLAHVDPDAFAQYSLENARSTDVSIHDGTVRPSSSEGTDSSQDLTEAAVTFDNGELNTSRSRLLDENNQGNASVLEKKEDASDKNTSASGTMLHIVTSQRDRFRKRILELEAELSGEKVRTQSMQREVDRIRADNVKLYEKIKFLQSYGGNSTRGKHTTASNNAADDVMTKYSSEYEDSISPFHEFSANERRRRVQNLNPGDRLTLSLGSAVLRNKKARWAFIAYAIFLHFLIFIVLYKYSHMDITMNLVEKCHHLFANRRMGDLHSVHGVEFDSSELHHSG